jgi:hypothetical protein
MKGGEDHVVTSKILKLLHLDAQSDITLLNGLTQEGVQKLYSDLLDSRNSGRQGLTSQLHNFTTSQLLLKIKS